MKRKWLRMSAMVLIVGMLLSTAVVAQRGRGKGKRKDPSYWDKFKTVFVDWDDDAPKGSPRTETTGVRGGKELAGKLGNDYDLDAVTFMEDFTILMDEEDLFLEQGGVGPYKAE